MKSNWSVAPIAKRRRRELRFSLIEITLAVLILGIGLTSILTVFPVAIRWGEESSASNTGAMAGRAAAALIQYSADEPGTPMIPVSQPDYFSIGTATDSYFCQYIYDDLSPSINHLYPATIRIYRNDFRDPVRFPAGSRVRAEAEKHLCIFKTYIYDP